MAKTIFYFLSLSVIMVLAQVIVFNRICLFGVAIPLAFIYTIMKLPVTLNVNWVMTISFILGITVDIFSDTQGINALSCTILSVMRMPTLRLFFSREYEMNNPIPSPKSLGTGVFMRYVFTLSLIYCLCFFLIESFSLFNPARLAIKIASSSVLTFVIIVAIDSLTAPRREKKL